MAYEVISIGDGEILANAFQGVAMLFNGGHLRNLVMAGFILGIIISCISYLMNLEFRLYQVFVGLIVYLVLFVPKDTVVIEDIYTGGVRTVANVPIGVAVPLSIISRIGVETTTLFESAFSIPTEADLLSNGYLNSLKLLLKMRNFGIGTASSDSSMAGDIGQNILDYIDQCVMFDIEMGNGAGNEVTRESLMKATDTWAAMKTSFIGFDILMRLPNSLPNAQTTCNSAYLQLTQYMNGTGFKNRLDRYAKGVLDIQDPTVTATDRLDSAMGALNRTGITAQTYMLNAMMASFLKEGPSAFITRSAKENLNMQWASEQSMFNDIARPLMTFVEMFTVAISPIVVFLITLGPFGLAMLARYLQLIAWVSLWGPLMAICNLYITIVATRALDSLDIHAAANGTGFGAMMMHDEFMHPLEVWVATGSMLAASVPALSLMIVYGGSVAANNLAGKMTSAASSSIKPERLMPETMTMAPVTSIGGFEQGSRYGGFNKTGRAETMNTLGSTVSGIQQSSRSQMTQASHSISDLSSQINQHSNRSAIAESQTKSVMSGISSTTTSGSTWQTSDGRTASSGGRMTNQKNEAIRAGVNTALSLGTGNIGPSVAASLLSNTDTSVQEAKEWGDLAQHVATKSGVLSDQNTTTSGSSEQDSLQTTETDEQMSALGKSYNEQTGRLLQAAEAYETSSSLNQSYSSILNEGGAAFGQRLWDTGAAIDISRRMHELEDKMPADRVSDINSRVDSELAASSMTSGFRMSEPGIALRNFKKLQEMDPVGAMQIVKDNIMPSTFKNDNGAMSQPSDAGKVTNPNSIMSDAHANATSDKAHGVGSHLNYLGAMPGEGNGRHNQGLDDTSARDGGQQGLGASGGNAQEYLGAIPLTEGEAEQLKQAGAKYEPAQGQDSGNKTKPVGFVQLSEGEANSIAETSSSASLKGGSAQVVTDGSNRSKPVVVMDLPVDQADSILGGLEANGAGSGKPIKVMTLVEDVGNNTSASGKFSNGEAGNSDLQTGNNQAGGNINHQVSVEKDNKNIRQNEHFVPSSAQGVGDDFRSKVEQEIGGGANPNEATNQIAKGAHLDRAEVDGVDMLYRAGSNHPFSVESNKAIDRILGIDRFHDEVEKNVSDNDLPPLPKE